MEIKGQVTVFVIIAIIIVAAGSMFFVFKDNLVGDKPDIPVEIAPIKNFVDSCIESEIEEVIILIGEGGGYFFPPALSTIGGYTYYFYNGETYFPSRNEIEDQLSKSLEYKVDYCVGNFKDFSGYEIEKKSVEIDVDLLDDSILFDVTFPLKIVYGENSYILKDFGEKRIYVRMGLIHKLIDSLIKDDYYNEDSICLDCFAEIVFENEMDVNVLDGGLGNSIFVVSDYNEETNKTFEFVFAA